MTQTESQLAGTITKIHLLLHGPQRVGRQHRLKELSGELIDLWNEHMSDKE